MLIESMCNVTSLGIDITCLWEAVELSDDVSVICVNGNGPLPMERKVDL